ncbi:hypothetical protein [Pelagicoccus albus]|uniref:Outer membrane efflux protein n=1 Tax=Pelagicoccus albus TaxID=415222 RepID=A0A7X1B601_9BACT|nr:hypothetical protein [Pelagicoccus albus]MBC2606167.1 hypothetical protein [Pelagicoccus albus]
MLALIAELFAIVSRLVAFLGVLMLLIVEAEGATDPIQAVNDWVARVDEEMATESDVDEVDDVLSRLVDVMRDCEPGLEELRLKAELVKANAKAGLAWPDPELRVTLSEDEDGDGGDGSVGLRLRFPDKTDRRVIKRAAEVELDYLASCIQSLERRVDCRARGLLSSGSLYRRQLICGIRRLRELTGLYVRTESAESRSVECSKLARQILKGYSELREQYREYELVLSQLTECGLSDAQAELVVAGWRDRLDTLPSLASLESQALRYNLESIKVRRDEALVLARIEAQNRGWIPEPTFAEFNWGDELPGENSDHGGRWKVKTGVSIDLFSDHESERLNAMLKSSSAEKNSKQREVVAELRVLYRKIRDEETLLSVSREWLNGTLLDMDEAIGDLLALDGDPEVLVDLREERFRTEKSLLEGEIRLESLYQEIELLSGWSRNLTRF